MDHRQAMTVLGLAAVALVGGGCMSAADIGERTALAEAGLLKERPGFPNSNCARIYTYYPDIQVYHNVWQDRYYWQDNFQWKSGLSLPGSFNPSGQRSVTVELFTARPYTEHEQVLAMHPPTDTMDTTRWASVPSE
jgi:hypothetical protein